MQPASDFQVIAQKVRVKSENSEGNFIFFNRLQVDHSLFTRGY